jgi:hypothetical protein
MKVFIKLLSEFWLPLVLGIAWTAFNFLDRPLSEWTIREVVNVFGPTFFFASWLVAQWYRVQKQQRVENDLNTLQRDITAIHSPLLPLGLFITLRFEATDDDVHRIFNDAFGYRLFDGDMPPPPLGLIPGMTEGRVHGPNRYFDYRNSAIEAAGFHNQNHPGFNTIHCAVRHTATSLSEEQLLERERLNTPICSLPSVRVEVSAERRTQAGTEKSPLVLRGIPKTHQISAARAFDATVFVDHVLHMVPESGVPPQVWSVSDLKGADLRISMDFFFIEPMFYLPSTSWPTLHNLQLWIGPKAERVLSFSLERLSTQAVRENPRPVASGQAKCVQLLFEYSIDESAYSECLLASG